jgi:NAD-dependent DNA ligase
LNLHLRRARNTSGVVGVLRGLIADGKVSHERMVFLGRWLLTNKEFAEEFPFNELFVKVDNALKARHIGEQDRREINLIERITGTDNSEGFENAPTTYPLTDPPPEIVFAGSEFVLTGTFEFGARKEFETEIVARGGTCGQYVTRRTRCLVIGKLSSRDWTNTSWGNKVRDAASRRESHIR